MKRIGAFVLVAAMLAGCGGGGGGDGVTAQADELCFGLDIHGALGWGPCDEICSECYKPWEPPQYCREWDERTATYWTVPCEK
jgi:hypothetical protein